MSIARSLLAVSLAALLSSAALAQHKDVPFRGGIPVAPSGLADKPLGDGPFDYATGEGQNIRVAVLTKALSYPFTLTFLPDGALMITQRERQVARHAQRQARPEPGRRRSRVVLDGHVGSAGRGARYMDIALHPQFAQNQTLYLSYTKPLGTTARRSPLRAPAGPAARSRI
jgi:glucose/arabinose dehydrogenase